MRFPVECDQTSAEVLRDSLSRIGEFSDADFRALQWALVNRYRMNPQDQEWIAVELNRPSRAPQTLTSIDRIDETLAMLDHVHDPLISGSSLHA